MSEKVKTWLTLLGVGAACLWAGLALGHSVRAPRVTEQNAEQAGDAPVADSPTVERVNEAVPPNENAVLPVPAVVPAVVPVEAPQAAITPVTESPTADAGRFVEGTVAYLACDVEERPGYCPRNREFEGQVFARLGRAVRTGQLSAQRGAGDVVLVLNHGAVSARIRDTFASSVVRLPTDVLLAQVTPALADLRSPWPDQRMSISFRFLVE